LGKANEEITIQPTGFRSISSTVSNYAKLRLRKEMPVQAAGAL
jgi:hypothetical protein